jgi:hypothetical protein
VGRHKNQALGIRRRAQGTVTGRLDGGKMRRSEDETIRRFEDEKCGDQRNEYYIISA